MAVDMFLKLDGIKGESADHKHKDEIHIESFSFGLAQTGTGHTGGGGGAGKVAVQDITVSKYVDKSSPHLLLHCANGTHIKEGNLYVRKAGGTEPVEYLKIKMVDVLISSVQESSGGGDLLMESVSLNFKKFHVEYQEQDEKGKPKGSPIPMGWDIAANVKA